LLCFFFFQAEDGIRDKLVTGVQTLLFRSLLVERGEESRYEAWNVLLALPERRDPDLDDVQAIVEIFPELTPGNRLLEIAIRRRDDTRVDVDRAVTADPRETKILQHVQELRLERQGQFRDLVEIEGTGVRVLELSRFAAVRPREGSFLVSEEFGLEQAVRDGGAVDLDEGPIRAVGGGVKAASHEVFADAALAADQHRRVGVRDALDQRPNLPHRWTAVQQRDVVGGVSSG